MIDTQNPDIRELAVSIQKATWHMSQLLDVLATYADGPLRHQLVLCAATAELASDKAIMIKDMAA